MTGLPVLRLPCTLAIPSDMKVISTTAVGLYRLGVRDFKPLVMFKCHLTCLQGPSSQQRILWRLWNGGASWRTSTKSGGAMQRRRELNIFPGCSPQGRTSIVWLKDSKKPGLSRLSDFVESLDEEEVRRCVRDVRLKSQIQIFRL